MSAALMEVNAEPLSSERRSAQRDDNRMIVMKFGGTSVGSAEAIRRVASIVDDHLESKPVVIVSAIGGTTQQLLNMGAEAARGGREKALEWLEELREVHEEVVRGATTGANREIANIVVDSHFRELRDFVNELSMLGELSSRDLDVVASFGERLASELVTLAFRTSGISSVSIDARDVIVTDARYTRATPLYPQTYCRLKKKVLPLARQGAV